MAGLQYGLYTRKRGTNTVQLQTSLPFRFDAAAIKVCAQQVRGPAQAVHISPLDYAGREFDLDFSVAPTIQNTHDFGPSVGCFDVCSRRSEVELARLHQLFAEGLFHVIP